MPRTIVLALSLATLPAAAFAQQAYPADQQPPSYTQSQAAPIQRPASPAITQTYAVTTTQPAQGVTVRVEQPNALHTVVADAQRTELRLDHGRANVIVHDPAPDSLVLVDLPTGQTQLLKNGLYTFNADTSTTRVMHGEALAFLASNPAAKPLKVKEGQQLVFTGSNIRSSDIDPYYARTDLLPWPAQPGAGDGGNHGDGYAVAPYGYAPYGFYGDGFYGYPYYAYGWGYPYGFGWGWGGGFYRGYGYGGGFRGGYHGGYAGGGGYHGGGGGGFHGGGGGGGHR